MSSLVTWPDDLDALIAAPRHHRLLMENEKVRVLDARIPPGETTRLHTHRYPATHYFLGWSDFVRRDADGHLLLDSRSLEKKPTIGSAMWSDPMGPHTLTNVGDSDLHVVSVEMKGA
jgi:hypothetical protein